MVYYICVRKYSIAEAVVSPVVVCRVCVGWQECGRGRWKVRDQVNAVPILPLSTSEAARARFMCSGSQAQLARSKLSSIPIEQVSRRERPSMPPLEPQA